MAEEMASRSSVWHPDQVVCVNPSPLGRLLARHSETALTEALADTRVVGIEVKASSTVGPGDFSGLRHLAARTGADFVVGVVLYTGTQTLPFGPKMRAIPAAALWEV
jgi:hypothetical protein